MGGAELHVLNLLGALTRRGHRCAVAPMCLPFTLREQFLDRGVEVLPLGDRRRRDFPGSPVRLGALIRRWRPDIVHAHLFLAELTVAASSLARDDAGRVVTFHNLAYDSHPADRHWRRFRRRVERLSAACAFDRRLAVSTAVANHYQAHLCLDDVTVMFNASSVPLSDSVRKVGRSEIRGRHGLTDRENVVLIPGKLRQEKGHAVLFEAAALLRERAVPVHVLVAGEGPLRAELEDARRRLSLVQEVTFTGRLPHPVLLEYMTAADVVVLASSQEGYPLSGIEAISLGMPLVATQVGGLPELVEDGVTGWLVPPGDARALAATIERVLKDPETRRVVAERGAAEVRRRHNSDRIAQLHEDVYHSIR